MARPHLFPLLDHEVPPVMDIWKASRFTRVPEPHLRRLAIAEMLPFVWRPQARGGPVHRQFDREELIDWMTAHLRNPPSEVHAQLGSTVPATSPSKRPPHT